MLILKRDMKPNFKLLGKACKDRAEQGFRIGSLGMQTKALKHELLGIGSVLRNDYGINLANSNKDIKGYFDSISSVDACLHCYKKGKWVFNKDTLQVMSARGYTVASLILKYRELEGKLKILNSLEDNLGSDGKVRPHISVTRTNRYMYTEPPLHQLNEDYFGSILKPIGSDANRLVSVDVKGQEGLIWGHLTESEILKGAAGSDDFYLDIFKKIMVGREIDIHILPDSIGINKQITGESYVKLREKGGLVKGLSNAQVKKLCDNNQGCYFTSCNLDRASYDYPSRSRAVKYGNEFVVGFSPIIVGSAARDINGYLYNLELDVLLSNGETVKMGLKPLYIGADEIKGVVTLRVGIDKLRGWDLDGEIKLNISKAKRDTFKVSCISYLYGAGKETVKDEAGTEFDGEFFYENVKTLGGLAGYIKEQERKLREKEPIVTYFGTELKLASDKTIVQQKRSVVNMGIQGTASDIIALLYEHVIGELKLRGLQHKVKFYMYRFDELVFEVDKDYFMECGFESSNELLEEFFKELCNHQVDGWQPFKLDVKVLN